ncbi:hypothetical protein PGT21_019565 [Puccinia graminis f. sp. tritici]|uniref:Uncharacterized protein n=1 Tax=Puccinia graminis f. sp. tritici TaxID=56615 RepID=A0A5B0PDS6_PUCGR|nr:hypothetical protein PGTUg99_030460 [Puccinia graminis f. sp. tritici]KAA1099757.1 hypothetical protein PGT21_019565 [Puccinia graminis f. sp. tritici]
MRHNKRYPVRSNSPNTTFFFSQKGEENERPLVQLVYNAKTSSTSSAAFSPPLFRCEVLTSSGLPPFPVYPNSSKRHSVDDPSIRARSDHEGSKIFGEDKLRIVTCL